MSPLCQSVRGPEQLDEMEPHYPLHVYVCHRCWLVQLRQYVRPQEIFSEYAYFSSYSESWLAHARRYCEEMIDRFHLGPQHRVVEIASNDGYLLKNFVARQIPVLGIEPAENVARVAQAQGVASRVMFFGREAADQLVREGIHADLLIGNNVLAHVPDLNGFVAGMQRLLSPAGVITMEFPHLLRLMRENQFDTIYHEHYSYLSLLAVEQVFQRHGLAVFDVERLTTHGGSLRIFARHEAAGATADDRVHRLRQEESEAGLDRLATYQAFAQQVEETKLAILEFFIQARRQGRSVAGYGAPGKGVTLLQYCGIGRDLLPFTVDRSPHKQGKYLPGSRIPIHDPARIAEMRPDYLFILPWNLRDEIMQQQAHIRSWQGKFVVPIPQLTIC